MALKTKLLQHIQHSSKPTSGGEVEDLSREWGYMGGNGTRRCRELVTEGKIYASYVKGHVFYSSTKAPQSYQEPSEQAVERYEEPLFSQPYTRPVKMPKAWLQLKDKLRHRPSSTTFYEAGSGQRNLQSDTYVSPVSFQENIKGISGSEIL